MTIETKTTKNGNVTVKVDGERTSIKIAAKKLNRAMTPNSNITAEIVNEAGEKFTYGGTEWKQSYTHYHFNNDNGKSFEIRDYVRNYNEIAEEAIRTIANMPAVEASKAAYNKAMDAIIAAETEPAEVNTEIQEETKMTIETKISANGSANIYVDGKKTANAAAVEIAEANGLPTYEARVYTYGENCLSKEFATAIAAHKWLVGKMKRDIAASVEIHRWNNRREETTIFADADQSHTINADDEPEFANYIYPLFTAEHLESQFDRMNNFAAQLTREGLTAEQINEVLTAQYANQNGNAHCKLIAEFKKANADDEAKAEFARKVADKLFLVERFSQEQVDAVVAAILDGQNADAVKKLIDDFKTENFNEAQKIAQRLDEIIAAEEAAAKADEPQGYIFSKTLVSSGYSAHNNAHYSKLERIDKECKILGNSEQTNGSIYREVAFYNADHAHSWAVKTSDGKVIISGHDEPDFDKIVAAVNNAEAKAADNISDINEPCHETATVDEPAAIAKFKVGHFYKGGQKYGNKTLEIKIRVTRRTNKTIFYVTRDDQDYEFKSKIKLDGKTEFISDTGGRFAKAADEVTEPVNNGDTPSPENKEDTSMTNTKPTATTDEIREACMEAQTQLETKIAAGAPQSEVKAVVDKDGNEIKPTTPLTSAEMNAAIDRLVAEFDREQAEAQKPLSLADLKAKYDASEDEAERVAIAINAYRKFLEPEKIKQERQIAEQVCASLTADAPQGWAVTFTDKGNYEVTAHGLSAATLDTITAGDFINPKAFFAKFNRTQADIDNERETAIAELKNQREQLLNMRAELVADFPDEKERLKILDEMIAETDQDIAVFENLAWKPGMFDDKHFNEDKLPF